jgi:hypothetical protein
MTGKPKTIAERENTRIAITNWWKERKANASQTT